MDAWMAVGVINTGGSYGVARIYANPNTNSFEMAVSGKGLGYCGAQFNSDGVGLNFIGSGDMGTTCSTNTNACVSPSDLTTLSQCKTPFKLIPIGRVATTFISTSPPSYNLGESQYPGGGNNKIKFENLSTDSVFFGPLTTPTPNTMNWNEIQV